MFQLIDTHLDHGSMINNPDTIVVHAMAEYLIKGDYYQHAVPFLNEYKLSAHILIAPDGTQYVCRYDNEGAWHSRGYNTNSLGIEFLVPGKHNYSSFIKTIETKYISDDQLQSGTEVISNWIKMFNINKIVKHSTLSPDRKVDPGNGFPWDDLITKVRA